MRITTNGNSTKGIPRREKEMTSSWKGGFGMCNTTF